VIAPLVLWIDPGGMTGLAVYEAVSGGFEADEFEFHEACSRIEWYCQTFRGTLAIGWERYTPRPDKPQTNAADALCPIGVARYVSRKYRCLVLPEGPQMTPKTADRKLLADIGWWVPGKNDAQSAAHHMLKWMMRSGNVPPAIGEKVSVHLHRI